MTLVLLEIVKEPDQVILRSFNPRVSFQEITKLRKMHVQA